MSQLSQIRVTLVKQFAFCTKILRQKFDGENLSNVTRPIIRPQIKRLSLKKDEIFWHF
jgi:hypothetical protein